MLEAHITLANLFVDPVCSICWQSMRNSAFVPRSGERTARKSASCSSFRWRIRERNVARWEAGARLFECTVDLQPAPEYLSAHHRIDYQVCRGLFGGMWRIPSDHDLSERQEEESPLFFLKNSVGEKRKTRKIINTELPHLLKIKK